MQFILTIMYVCGVCETERTREREGVRASVRVFACVCDYKEIHRVTVAKCSL